MTSWRWVRRSLRYHWRTHLGIVAGVAVGGAILVGALEVGDSVKGSLARMKAERLGSINVALASPDRFFRDTLAAEINDRLHAIRSASVLMLRGAAARADGTARVNRVQIVGSASEVGGVLPDLREAQSELFANDELMRRLGMLEDTTLVVRWETPSLLPRDALLAKDEGATSARRVLVRRTWGEGWHFSLRSDQSPPATLFWNLAAMQQAVGLDAKANVMLFGPGIKADEAQALLKQVWQLADAELELRELSEQKVVELRSARVFLDAPIADVAKDAAPGAVGVLTYLVNELRKGERATPYSMVTALGPLAANGAGRAGGAIPLDLGDDEIVINSWLAEDLGAAPGDTIDIAYFVADAFKRVREEKAQFRVRTVVPLEACDPMLMPQFPGLADSDTCKEWESGLPIDTEKIRDKDEAYWDAHRGAPKAFVSLSAGRRMWANRFGDLTAIRYPAGDGVAKAVKDHIHAKLDPASIGLVFEDVGARADAGIAQGVDFGMLFVGMSFFLLVAALLLVGLLFALSIEARVGELGTLHALGVPRRTAGRLFLAEGVILAAVGACLGPYGGVLYTQAVLWALETVWRGALGLSILQFHVVPGTIAIGIGAIFVMACAAMACMLRVKARMSIRALLAPAIEVRGAARQTRVLRTPSFIIGTVAFVAALAIVALGGDDDRTRAGAFFGAGALLLTSALACSGLLLRLKARAGFDNGVRVLSMALKNAARRRGRSLAVVALLACGTFLVIAVGANRQDPLVNADARGAGTGGFAFFGDTTIPVIKDLNAPEGRKEYALDEDALKGVRFVPFRVREGDDASCLNLQRAQRPQLFGVDPDALGDRFTFLKVASDSSAPWKLLDAGGEEVPAIGDENTVTWSLGAKVGSTLPYVDERGREFKLKIVGVVARSILQGGLVISEKRFLELFPSQSGYSMFLIDAAGDTAWRDEVRKALTRTLEDAGLALVPCVERLAAFNVVEHTYLSIFQALGGLGLLLGSVGLGVVVLRNVLERRGELALLRAVGVPAPTITGLVLLEHLALVVLGVVCGVGAALVAVMPALASPGTQVPVLSLYVTVAFVVDSAGLWTWGATVWALRGAVTEGLKSE